MKRWRFRALVAGIVIVEIALATTAAVASADSLPPKCSTELVARCENAPGGSIACLRSELSKVKDYCRQALLAQAFPGAIRPD